MASATNIRQLNMQSCQLHCLLTRARRIGNFRSNRIVNLIGGTIRIRIESRIESEGSRLHVQCRMSCGSCVFNNV